MIKITIADGLFAIVDYPDFIHALSKWGIYRTGAGDVACVVRKKGGKAILLHRAIIGAQKGDIVDHVNGDPLDNRRLNIRLCTHDENMRNRRMHRNNRCGVKGVYACRNKWRATIRVGNRKHHLGMFESLDAARAAYDAAAVRLHGEFARTNT